MKVVIGPHVRKLIAARISVLAIPPNTKEPLKAGIDAILIPGRLQALTTEALQWVQQVLALVKQAPDNPYGNDDEVIAQAILEEVDKRNGGST